MQQIARWATVDFLWTSQLANAPLRHHRQTVGKTQSLALIVSHEDSGDAQLTLDFPKLDLHRGSQIFVERGKRLVEQQYFRIDHQCAGERNALLLSTGQFARLAIL